MKRFFRVLLVLLLVVVVSGCGEVSTTGKTSGTISCVSEEHGTDPKIVNYEEYVVLDNKIESVKMHQELTYSNSLLGSLKIEDYMKPFDDDEHDVEKVNNNTFKVIDLKPYNAYENSQTDDMISLIVNSLENNDFLLYQYKCEVK